MEDELLTKTAYDMIAHICGLKLDHANIYKDEKGNKFYLDKYGFHSNVTYSNHELLRKQKTLDKAIEHYNRPLPDDPDDVLVTRKTKKNIKRILRDGLSAEEKVKQIASLL